MKKYIILLIIIIGFLFYWYAYLPGKIRHECSWVRRVTTATSAQPAITKEDVENSKVEYDKCVNEGRGGRLFCEYMLKQEGPAIPAKPEQVWYEKADSAEYNFCIHEQGLKQ